MHLGYKRVSTKDQNTDRQLQGIHLDKEPFIDYISGAKLDRPNLELCLLTLREGDVLHVHSADRLARKLTDALHIIERVLKAGATIIIYSPRLEFTGNTSNPYSLFQLQLFSSVAELERGLMRERQREGIARVKITGTKSGRPFGKPPLDMTRRDEALRLRSEGLSNRKIALEMKLSRPSIAKLLA